MAAEDRSRSESARVKRREQLSRWTGSETDRSEAESRDRPGGTGQSRYRVRFAQGAVFMAACSAGDREEVRGLLQQGAAINHTNVDGLTALHQACIDENLDMVEFLVEHGANVNQPDNEGWTPLHAAASCGFTEIAGFLIKKGASVAAVNSEGELPLDVAQESAMERLLQAEIKKQGVDVELARQEEKRMMLQDAQQYVNQGKVTVSRHPKTGATDLHVAAAKGYLEVIKLLLKAGFDVNVKDNDGWSSLHAAAHWGQEEVCRLLGESLCDMQAVNKVGQTAFDVADESLVEMLEELQKKQSQLRIEKEKQAKLQPAVIETSPLSQSAQSRTRRSSISRMSSKEKISLHDKERRALETLEPVAFEGVEEERRREGESSSSSSEEESDTESETESEKVKTREMINNLNNKLNSSAIAAATSGLGKKGSSSPSKPPAAPRSATGGVEEEKKDGAAPATSWRTSLRKTGSYGALNSAGAPGGQEESKARDSSGGVSRSASSPRLTGTETEAKDRESREPRLARVPPTPTRRLFSIPDSSQEPPSSSSYPRQPATDNSTDVTGTLARSSSYTRRLNSQSGSEVTSSTPSFQRSSSFGRKAEDSGTTSTSSALSRLNALTAQRLARQTEDKDAVSTTATTSSSSSSATASTQSETKERRRSYLTPVRDEEAEAQRKARSRHARQSRRSTQGVTLTDLHEAEKTMKGQQEARATEQREEERKREEEKEKEKEKEKERAEALSKHRASRTGEEGEVSWRSRIANLQKSDLLGLTTPADPSRPARAEESKEAQQSTLGEKDDKLGPGVRDRRRPRGKRRGEGLNNTSDDEEDTGEEEGGGRAEQADRLNRGELMANDRNASRGSSLHSRSSSAYSRSDPSETDRKDYKKLYEEMSRENARLQSQFQDSQKKIIQTKGELDKASQMQERFADRSVLLEMEKKERRSLERRVSELDEDIEVLSNLKADNQRLKDENGALIRVISKLSK
ncbi:protein phosphatase 1 regulatory subunit 12A-like isoform X2 [Acipenser ruthenus]|uniref:protein phosphatase 1 regulatory subunit 12A-like isoform X2 n=1 Tax=Acipenser ruthenus TaxID=7906 RepID=UPI001560D120|nr:protein phosphatase 1 regulatory subunit 12A-like isoform X2 [Acipenser ruthenus]